VMGTPAFMPREQALGWVKEIDGRTDLWAVGATMFTLVSGEMVHQADTPEHIVVLTATQPARPFGSVVAVPPAIAAVVDRSLAFAKDDRFPDARSMQQALEQAYLASFGIPLSGPAPFAFAASGSTGTAPMFGTPPVIMAPQLGTQPATPSASTTGGVAAVRAETLVAPTSTSNKTAIVASLIAGAAVVALGATLVVRLGGAAHSTPTTEGSAAMGAAAPPTPPPPAAPPPPVATNPPAAPVAEEATTIPAAASTAPAAPSARPSREPAHTPPPAPRPVPATTAPPTPRPPAVAPAPPPGPATPNCDPPWFVDPVTHGRKVKPGC
jgi:outer membrane biosynthesis protein TonB